MPRLNQADFFSTTLTAAVNGGSLEYFVDTTVGGPASPCIIILNPDVPAKREIVRANGTFTGTKFASLGAGDRDLAGSGNVDHAIGDTVWVSVTSYDLDAVWDDIEAVETTASAALPKAGGTMTGDLVLAGAPNADLKAATKKYVDDVAAAVQSAAVATSEDTTSTTFTDLITSGPAVTVTVPASGRVLVIFGAIVANSGAAAVSTMSFELSGANTLAADDARRAYFRLAGTSISNEQVGVTAQAFLSGLTAGSTTFTAKYKTSANTARFFDRTITVIPL